MFSNQARERAFSELVARISANLRLIREEQQQQTKIMIHNARGKTTCGQTNCPVCGQS